MTEEPRPRRKRRRRPASEGEGVGKSPRRRKPATRKAPRSQDSEAPVKKKTGSRSGRKQKKKRKDHDEGLSTKQVVILLMIGIGLFGWACSAAAYAHAKEGWRSNEAERFAAENGDDLESDSRLTRRRAAKTAMIKTAFHALMDFIGNAFKQLPNCVAVIAFTFSERLWLVILFAVLEAGAVGLGYVMEKVGESFVETPRY
ncbi:hypothetical protein Pan153_15330 [Gimesia panareensis]|uniref:Transmembrane protein n=1 Tax=Gimesia panareensis TaxID=2527978 RepID=A0A518FKP3_9PLAN|nr:hypothetical protein [Gimesia panareensis]QDV16899.1 hypothetical protein Pan153_15330 [Gimesia panareensis]